MISRITLFILFMCCTLFSTAQMMTESDYIRSGNKFYADSLFEKAEIEYRKALDLNPSSVDALYNLGNALFNQISQSQEKGQEAMQQYVIAAKIETDKQRLAQMYHNIGVLSYLAQQYPQSVEAFKESMRNNPHDNETRYNLAKAIHMCKQQDKQQDQQEDQQQDQNQQQNQQDRQEEQQQQDKEEQQQQQQQQEAQQSEEKISEENAEQILNALMQDEKEIQEKQQKMMQQQQGKTLDKDW